MNSFIDLLGKENFIDELESEIKKIETINGSDDILVKWLKNTLEQLKQDTK